MKVLSIVHGPVFGGGNNQVAHLHEPLARRGWEVRAAVPDVPEGVPTLERMRAAGVPTDAISLHRLRRTLSPRIHAEFALSIPREIRMLRRMIREHDIDLVQAFGETNPHLAIAGHLEGRGVVWHLYDLAAPQLARTLGMTYVKRLADVILTWGRGMADRYPGATSLGDRWIPVYPPVDCDLFRPDPQRRAAARQELGVPDDALLIGTVGNRNPTKRHDVLVEAVRHLRDRGVDVWCRVFGQRSPAHERHMAEIDALVERLGVGDRVSFLDPGSRVAELLPALDVFAMSSESEGMPTVIVEAMASGLPIVATDVGSIREVVEDGPCGIVVPPLDPPALADAIAQMLADPAARAELGRANRERALERYATERVADVYAAAYERAVEHRRSRRRRTGR